MAKLKTDSPLPRRIVTNFLRFLDSVEPASEDLESLEVAKECLLEVFKINPSSVASQSEPDLLLNIFSSQEASERDESNSGLTHEGSFGEASSSQPVQSSPEAPTSPPLQNAHDVGIREGEDWTSMTRILEVSKDELFGQFFGALEKVGYFKITHDGGDDPAQLDKATNIFHNALTEMQNSGCKKYDTKNLAETLKSQGNKAMQSKLYFDAIELYTCAIALCRDNAIYYCNRAAAFTQIHQYAGAISDCQKSIQLDPNYAKAYSRLGFTYYSQGNYKDAIEKGFKKALQLDPNNASVHENIRVAEEKLKEQQQRTEHDRDSSSTNIPGESSNPTSPPFASMPFNINGFPSNVANMFMNMASNVYQDRHSAGDGVDEGRDNSNGFTEPNIRMGGNINVNLGENIPEELSGALRSMMEMFSGVAPNGNPQDSNMSGRAEPR